MTRDSIIRSCVNRVALSIEQDRCLPFLGAGISAWQDVGAPGTKTKWKAFIDRLPPAPESRGDRTIRILERELIACKLMHGGKPLSALPGAPPTWFLFLAMLLGLNRDERARVERERWPFNTLAEHLYKESPYYLAGLLNTFFVKVQPNSIHERLALFPFRVLITTNFDCGLESACEVVGAPLNTRVNDAEILGGGIVQPLLLKLHGDFERMSFSGNYSPERAKEFIDQVVLTNTKYWGFPEGSVKEERRRLMMEYMRVLMATHQMVFLGYSLSDFNVIELLHDLSQFGNSTHKPIVVVKDNSAAKQALWKSRRFELLPCDHGEFLNMLWARLYDNISQDDVDEVQSSALSGDRRLGIPLAILMQHAHNNSDALKTLARQRLFKRRHLACGESWPNARLQLFLNQKWMRCVNPSASDEEPDDRLFEFSAAVRQGLLAKLNMI
jgi:hypothetical protein